MKKIILAVLFIFIFSFALKIKSFAYSDSDVAYELLQDLRSKLNNQNIGITSDFLNLAQFWNEHPNYILLTGGSNGDYYYRVGEWNNITSTSAQLVSDGYSTTFFSSRDNTFYSGVMTSATYAFSNTSNRGNLATFMPVVIDFDTVYFDATIPSPNISIEYTDLHSGYNVPFYLYFNDQQLEDDYYIDYRVQFRPVTSVNVEVNRGSVTYSNASSNSPFYNYDIISNSDLVKLSDLVTPTYYQDYKSLAEQYWEDCLTEYAPESSLTFLMPASLNNQMLIESYQNRYKTFRIINCMFGNYMRVWVRYFKIDDNNNYVVGAWRVWECYDSSTSPWGGTLPDYYQPYNEAVGTTNTYTDTDADTNYLLPMNQGQLTGGSSNPNTQVTVYSNVPNYPDYPTAASYNHDNLLVQFIQTANYLPQMFSGYSSFLAGAFGFIPPEIWTIIGFGFLSCIGVMIVKVL